MMIDKFVMTSDSQYDSIRKMIDLMEQKKYPGLAHMYVLILRK